MRRIVSGTGFRMPEAAGVPDLGVEPATLALPCTGSAEQKKTASPFALEKAAEVQAIIQADLRHHFSIPQLARKVGTNAKSLQDAFKQLYGKTIFIYGQELRLEHGKTLLQDPKLGIQEIAEECGYPDHSNFTKAFKKKFGVVPGRWRKGGN